jgi:hypothetical protein
MHIPDQTGYIYVCAECDRLWRERGVFRCRSQMRWPNHMLGRRPRIDNEIATIQVHARRRPRLRSLAFDFVARPAEQDPSMDSTGDPDHRVLECGSPDQIARTTLPLPVWDACFRRQICSGIDVGVALQACLLPFRSRCSPHARQLCFDPDGAATHHHRGARRIATSSPTGQRSHSQ